jgi:opacity protein-like surface antigen
MGTFKSIALAGLVAVATSAPALAADLLPPPPPPPVPVPVVEVGSGWYLRGDVGVGAQDFDRVEGADVVKDGGAFWRKNLADTAFVGVGVGYQVNNFLRFDVTGEYRTSAKYDISDKFQYQRDFGFPVDTRLTNRYTGDIQTSVFLANAYFDLGTWYGVTPFVGSGVGVAVHRVRNAFDNGLIYNFDLASGAALNTEATGGIAFDRTKSDLAWAVHAGLAYAVSPNLKLELAYRYLNMGHAETGALSCGVVCSSGSTFSPLKLKDIESHDIKIGMRWLLGTPVPVAVAEPLPAPVPLVRKY